MTLWLLLFLTVTDWTARVAVSDAFVTVRSQSTPDLPDEPTGSALVELSDSYGPAIPVKPHPTEARIDGPEIDVDVWIAPNCVPCNSLLSEMKVGGGSLKIRWRVRDYDLPMHAKAYPFIEWSDPRGRRRSLTGAYTRKQIESSIRQTLEGK